MNERETKIGRRNQTLFALGKVLKDEFRYSEIEVIVRQEFPETTKGRDLNIAQILAELSKKKTPLIKRSPKENAYLFKDPIYRMTLRTMLAKDKKREIVNKLEIARR